VAWSLPPPSTGPQGTLTPLFIPSHLSTIVHVQDLSFDPQTQFEEAQGALGSHDASVDEATQFLDEDG